MSVDELSWNRMILVFSCFLLIYPSISFPFYPRDRLSFLHPLYYHNFYALLSPPLFPSGARPPYSPPFTTPPFHLILFPHLFIVLFLMTLFDLYRHIPNLLSPSDAHPPFPPLPPAPSPPSLSHNLPSFSSPPIILLLLSLHDPLLSPRSTPLLIPELPDTVLLVLPLPLLFLLLAFLRVVLFLYIICSS